MERFWEFFNGVAYGPGFPLQSFLFCHPERSRGASLKIKKDFRCNPTRGVAELAKQTRVPSNFEVIVVIPSAARNIIAQRFLDCARNDNTAIQTVFLSSYPIGISE
jgi:hypothetical protein